MARRSATCLASSTGLTAVGEGAGPESVRWADEKPGKSATAKQRASRPAAMRHRGEPVTPSGARTIAKRRFCERTFMVMGERLSWRPLVATVILRRNVWMGNNSLSLGKKVDFHRNSAGRVAPL